MWYYIKKCRRENTLALLLLLLCGMLGAVSSVLLIIMNRALLEKNIEKIIWLVIIFLTTYLANALLSMLQGICQAKAKAKMNQEIRKNLNCILSAKSYENFLEKGSGEYLSWYTNDVREAEQGFELLYSLIYMAEDMILRIIILIVMAPSLLAITLFVSILNILMSKLNSDKLDKAAEKVSHAMEIFTNHVKEQILGFPVLKYFGHADAFGEMIEKASKSLEAERCSLEKKKAVSTLIMRFFGVVGFVSQNGLIYILCGFGIIPMELFAGGQSLTTGISGDIQFILESRPMLHTVKAYFEKFHLTKTTEEKKEQLPVIQNEINVENVSFAYGEKQVLDHMSMFFKIGGKYAIVGKSGTGKSTLLKILFGELSDYQGKVLFDGQDAKKYDQESFSRQMAYIEQNVFLFNKSIRENITMGQPFTEEEIDWALKRSALWQDMKHFPEGLETKVGENGNLLSGGQKQRVAVARALIHRCSILIMDEGTSALDRENAERIENALMQDQNLTLILVSHHLDETKERTYSAVYELANGSARRKLCGNI